MTLVHRLLGAAIVAALLVIMLWASGLGLARRDEAPKALWGLQHYTENLLVAQTVLGVVLLLIGRRLVSQPNVWLHYVYGSLFPLIALVGGRIAGLRRESREYLGLAWGALFAFGLTLRALMTGCGDLSDLGRCLFG